MNRPSAAIAGIALVLLRERKVGEKGDEDQQAHVVDWRDLGRNHLVYLTVEVLLQLLEVILLVVPLIGTDLSVLLHICLGVSQLLYSQYNIIIVLTKIRPKRRANKACIYE